MSYVVFPMSDAVFGAFGNAGDKKGIYFLIIFYFCKAGLESKIMW